MLLRYRDIREALTTPQVGALGAGMFELVGWTSGPLVDTFRTWLVTLDPPDHDRLRRLVSQPFTPRQVEAVRATTTATAKHLSGQLAEAVSADLYQAFAEPLPLAVLCDVLGVPSADHSVMAGWIQPMAAAFGSPTTEMRSVADEAMTAFSAYVTAMIDERRGHRGDDLLSRLIEAEEAGDRLSNEELVATTANLLFAGVETTRDLIGAAAFTLLGHPAELARLRRDPGLVPNAVEEVLRYEPPIILLTRPVLEGTVAVGGVTVEAGERLLMNVASANRDPEVMPRGVEFDVARPSPTHLSFSWGPHFCLGAAIARMEAAVALECLVGTFPLIEFEGDPPDWVPFSALRSLDRLPIRVCAA
jgi:unspecific monooxygenase